MASPIFAALVAGLTFWAYLGAASLVARRPSKRDGAAVIDIRVAHTLVSRARPPRLAHGSIR